MLLWNAQLIDGTGRNARERSAVAIADGRILAIDKADGSRPPARSTSAAGRSFPD